MGDGPAVARESRPVAIAPSLPRAPAHAQISLFLAILMGVALWWVLGRGNWGTFPQKVALGLAALAGALPWPRAAVTSALDRLRNLSPRGLRVMTLGVFAGTATYLLITALWQHRTLWPKWHDHQMTLLQAQMLAHGRLWMPQHSCADFFETFYIFVKPVYAAMYFPGAALFFVPAAWLDLPTWLMPLLASGAMAALLFRIVAELIDSASGLLAVLMLASTWIYRQISVWLMSHMVLAALALTAVWAWLRWRKSRHVSWAVLMGVSLGWAAITRPVDALAYGIPLGLVVLWDLRGRGARVTFKTLGAIAAAAVPFLALQLVLNRGITGSLLVTPVQHYAQVEFPGLASYGHSTSTNTHSTSNLLQKRLMGEYFVVPQHQANVRQTLASRLDARCRTILGSTLGAALFLVLIPAGLLGVRDPRQWVLLAPLPLFVAGYVFYPAALLEHYCIAVTPAVILVVLLGVASLERMSLRWGSVASTATMLALAAVSVTALPEFHPKQRDDIEFPVARFNYEVLPKLVSTPALVLYHYEPGVYASGLVNFHDEPVYNVDVAWPDDAPIIRAHDLGARDPQIIDYYAQIQPDRNVYLVNRADLKVIYLGMAGDVSRKLHANTSSGHPLGPERPENKQGT